MIINIIYETRKIMTVMIISTWKNLTSLWFLLLLSKKKSMKRLQKIMKKWRKKRKQLVTKISICLPLNIFALVTESSQETIGNIVSVESFILNDYGNYTESRFAALQNKNLFFLKKKYKTQTAIFLVMQSKLRWCRWCKQ